MRMFAVRSVMRALGALVGLLSSCVASPPPDARYLARLSALGLPEDAWAGFGPGSWARYRWTSPKGSGEVTFSIEADGHVALDPPDRYHEALYVWDVFAPFRGLPTWVEPDKTETIEIEGRKFLCEIRTGSIRYSKCDTCGHPVEPGLRAGADHVRVWRSPDAPTPQGILKWTVTGDSGNRHAFRYISLGVRAAVEAEYEWPGHLQQRNSLELNESVPGRVVKGRRLRILPGGSREEIAIELAEHHTAAILVR